MFVIKRNQVIITALVIMIAIAGYLNYVDNPSTKEVTVMAEETSLEQALVPNEDTISLIDTTATDDIVSIMPDEGEIGIAISSEGEATTAEITPVSESQVAGETDINITDTGETTEEPGTAVFVNAQMDSTYFVQAKLDREQARSKQREILTELINNEKLAKEDRSKSADAMIELQNRIEKETSAEAMIEAKGFSEAYVRIDDTMVDVVVSKAALSEAEIAQIEDIIKRKTGATTENIRIVPLKK